MISKQQLTTLANQKGLPLYQQEKEYALQLFLYFYYRRFADAIFKGGTSLRFYYGLDRFSEDLDFNIKNPKVFQQQVQVILRDFTSIGIICTSKEELFTDAYASEIKFAGPLFAGTSQTQNKFRLDAGYRTGTFNKPQWQLLSGEYPEIPLQFMVNMMHLEEIFAEKIMCLLQRKKGRDLYDVWFLHKAKVPVNATLVHKKARKEKVHLDFSVIASKSVYQRDMSKLTTKVIPYAQVLQSVLEVTKQL